METLVEQEETATEINSDNVCDLLYKAIQDSGVYTYVNFMMPGYETKSVIMISIGEDSPDKFTATEHYEIEKTALQQQHVEVSLCI